MTLGIDARWRRATVRALALPRRSRVVDLACGTGNLCRDLDAAGMCAVGVDIAAGMLSHARGAATFLRADVLRLPFRDAAFDGAVCGFALRNVVDLEAFFGECARVVRRSGRVAFLEVAQARRAVVRGMHTMHLRPIVPLIRRPPPD